MRQLFNITRDTVRGRDLDALISSRSHHVSEEEALDSVRKRPFGNTIVKSRPLMETLLKHGAKLATTLELPPLPDHVLTAYAGVAVVAELPPLPEWALQTVSRRAATNTSKTADEIVSRVSVGPRVSSEITPEFRKRAEPKATVKTESEIVGLLPAEMHSLAEVLHEALAIFHEDELEQVTSDWDWKSRHLAKKLSR